MYSYSATEMQEKIDFHGELFEEIREYPEAEKLEQVDKPQIRGWNFKLDLFSIRPQILKLCPNTAAHYLCRPNPPPSPSFSYGKRPSVNIREGKPVLGL